MMSRFTLAAVASLACIAVAQNAPSPVPASALALLPKSERNDELRIQANVASFKMVPKGDSFPAGKLSMSFKGTVLISDLAKGSYVQTSGDLRKEYDDHGKTVYFGKGHLLVIGKFRNCEWFGRNLTFDFKGSTVLRIVTEYDSNLKTGTYTYGQGKPETLINTMVQLNVPQTLYGPQPAITREDFEKQKKKGG